MDGAPARALPIPPSWPNLRSANKELVKGAVAAWLCHETVSEGNSVLLFCASKRICVVG